MNKNIDLIINLQDELHYLQNIVEYCDNENISIQDAIQNRIYDLYNKIEQLEK